MKATIQQISKSKALQIELMLEYKEVVGKEIFLDSCKGCIAEALEMIRKHRNKKNTTMVQNNCKYRLHKDVLIKFENGHYNNNNLTDDIAAKILERHPGHAKNFEFIPSDIVTVITSENEDVNTETIAELTTVKTTFKKRKNK